MDENAQLNPAPEPEPELQVEQVEAIPPPPPLPTAGRLAREAILDLLAAFGIAAIVAIIALGGTLATGIFQGQRPTPPGLGLIATLLVATQIPLFFFALRRLRKNRQRGRPTPALFEGPPSKGIIWGVSAGLGLTLVSGLYAFGVQKLLGEEALPQQLDFLKDLLQDPLAVAVIVTIIAVMAPICEELFFRGAIFGSATAVGQTRAGALISAVLFSIVHLSVVLAPFYLFFALVMCWLFLKTRTLLAPMAAHFTMNGLACIAIICRGGEIV